MHRAYTRAIQGYKKDEVAERVIDEFPAKKYKKRWIYQLSYEDKVKIVFEVLVKKESTHDAARKFRVSDALVSSLVKCTKKKPKYLEELRFE